MYLKSILIFFLLYIAVFCPLHLFVPNLVLLKIAGGSQDGEDQCLCLLAFYLFVDFVFVLLSAQVDKLRVSRS